MSNQILCITKSDRDNHYERITHVGGVNSNDEYWKFPQQEIIKFIESKKYAFYVNINGSPVDIIVSTSRFGNKYIKTQNDGDVPNNLLSLNKNKDE